MSARDDLDNVEQATALLVQAALAGVFRTSEREEARRLSSDGARDLDEAELHVRCRRALAALQVEEDIRAGLAGVYASARARAEHAALSAREIAQRARWTGGLSLSQREALVDTSRGNTAVVPRAAPEPAVAAVHPDRVLLSADEVAAMLGISRGGVYRRMRPDDGSVPLHGHQRVGKPNSRWEFEPQVVRAWAKGSSEHELKRMCGRCPQDERPPRRTRRA